MRRWDTATPPADVQEVLHSTSTVITTRKMKWVLAGGRGRHKAILVAQSLTYIRKLRVVRLGEGQTPNVSDRSVGSGLSVCPFIMRKGGPARREERSEDVDALRSIASQPSN